MAREYPAIAGRTAALTALGSGQRTDAIYGVRGIAAAMALILRYIALTQSMLAFILAMQFERYVDTPLLRGLSRLRSALDRRMGPA